MHVAHQADVLRLERLIEMGGIYLDPDVFVHRNFDDLLNHQTVLGIQETGGKIVGLCNAVILAQSGAPFLRRWYATYNTFRSTGHDAFWDEHSVRLPYQLAKDAPGEVTVLPNSAFFKISFRSSDIQKLYASKKQLDLGGVYASHLWETPAWELYLRYLTPGMVRSANTNFHQWARPFVADLPRRYGSPSLFTGWKWRFRRAVTSLHQGYQHATQRVLSRSDLGAHE
jgi:hypothetical protein